MLNDDESKTAAGRHAGKESFYRFEAARGRTYTDIMTWF
jgi:hypothetical protein